MRHERELVAQLGSNDTALEAMRALVGGVTATELEHCVLSEDVFGALVDGLSDPSPRVRWWCIQIFDHVEEERAMRAVAGCLDDPVPRVRRNAVHALTCDKCKPGGACAIDPRDDRQDRAPRPPRPQPEGPRRSSARARDLGRLSAGSSA